MEIVSIEEGTFNFLAQEVTENPPNLAWLEHSLYFAGLKGFLSTFPISQQPSLSVKSTLFLYSALVFSLELKHLRLDILK